MAVHSRRMRKSWWRKGTNDEGRLGCLFILWLLIVGGCSKDNGFELVDEQPLTAQDLRDAALTRVDLSELSTGDAHFGRLRAAQMNPANDEVALVTRAGDTPRIWIVDLGGKVKAAFGEEGGGPEEYGIIRSVRYLNSDTLGSLGYRNISIVSTEGDMVARRRADDIQLDPHLLVSKCDESVIIGGLSRAPAQQDGTRAWLWELPLAEVEGSEKAGSGRDRITPLLSDPIPEARNTSVVRSVEHQGTTAFSRRAPSGMVLLKGECSAGVYDAKVDSVATGFRSWRKEQILGSPWELSQEGASFSLPPIVNRGFAFDEGGRWILSEGELRDGDWGDALYWQKSEQRWIRRELPGWFYIHDIGTNGELLVVAALDSPRRHLMVLDPATLMKGINLD